MSKPRINSKESRKSKLDEMFVRADKMWGRGQLRHAFRLFLVAAKAGDKASQLNIGYFYDNGVGIKRNREAALRWYMRAYRRGDASAASNIGTIWRDEQKHRRALSWFQRAVKLGDDGSNIEIAIHYLRNERDPRKALRYLSKVCQSALVSEGELEKAKRLLREAQKQLRHA